MEYFCWRRHPCRVGSYTWPDRLKLLRFGQGSELWGQRSQIRCHSTGDVYAEPWVALCNQIKCTPLAAEELKAIFLYQLNHERCREVYRSWLSMRMEEEKGTFPTRTCPVYREVMLSKVAGGIWVALQNLLFSLIFPHALPLYFSVYYNRTLARNCR